MILNNDLMTRNVGRYPPSQESLFCMLGAIEPQPQAERTLSGVIFRCGLNLMEAMNIVHISVLGGAHLSSI